MGCAGEKTTDIPLLSDGSEFSCKTARASLQTCPVCDSFHQKAFDVMFHLTFRSWSHWGNPLHEFSKKRGKEINRYVIS
jgi:hypothetical protein